MKKIPGTSTMVTEFRLRAAARAPAGDKSGPRAGRRLGAVASPEGEGARGPKASIG